ncbi:MAG: 50S ribosomal protein L44e [Nanoarchaeota archaeon]|nr:50S ribosomal protein L44e [Nanoarchaeota archaeon]MBU1269059.1 50S ribosomal protein L44e [Nanoarchaeota archaeon]MBU1604954.1 50S ribosomal protein L44e [Nanoarchaeota archaeon]MBU2443316.1 50S ribosomal protein L44e [Nanoarchaeota archaeon]
MKKPKEFNRHCPFCNKHTSHKVSIAKKRTKGSAHPMSAGSKIRTMLRGRWRGMGNLGKYSKPPKPKMVGKKLSKKTDFRYTCKGCGKSHVQSEGIRAKKVELV